MLIYRLFSLTLVFLLTGYAGSALANSVTYEGYLNDTSNAALVSSDLTAPIFSSDSDVANNVAIYSLNIASAGSVSFESVGFALGGIDPYFTLFQGNGSSATLLGSNYDNAFSGSGGDFTLTYNLSAGKYMLAIGTFANLSFAENNPTTGTLADGFTGLGTAYSLGADPSRLGYYNLVVKTSEVSSVPEPTSALLLMIGLTGLMIRKRAKQGLTSIN